MLPKSTINSSIVGKKKKINNQQQLQQQKLNEHNNSDKWAKLATNDDYEVEDNENDNDNDNDDLPRRSKSSVEVFRRKKAIKKEYDQEDNNDDDDDLDIVPRRRKITQEDEKEEDDDNDDIARKGRRGASSQQRKSNNEEDGNEAENDEVDVTKCRVRRVDKEKELRKEQEKKRKEAKKAKYDQWSRGIAQQEQSATELADALHEADKPMARYANDKDLDVFLKKQQREDDPMAAYLEQEQEPEPEPEKGTQDPEKTSNDADAVKKKNKAVYKGPPAPPNRYQLKPGPRWDGVDRSNGFEKQYYESLSTKKAFNEAAYKWSVEDM